MHSNYSVVDKYRYFLSIFAIYILTIAFAWLIFHSNDSKYLKLDSIISQQNISKGKIPHLVYGVPSRIVIPDSSYNNKVVDLVIDPGYYDIKSDTWTLNGYHAQFAMISTPANNYKGETFIYGHNNDNVFGALRHVTPKKGSIAILYTDNGHIFSYSFNRYDSVSPELTSVLSYKGPSEMTIQTCTGTFNEIRTLYQYNFLKVVK